MSLIFGLLATAAGAAVAALLHQLVLAGILALAAVLLALILIVTIILFGRVGYRRGLPPATTSMTSPPCTALPAIHRDVRGPSARHPCDARRTGA
jgi:hypothetical protein